MSSTPPESGLDPQPGGDGVREFSGVRIVKVVFDMAGDAYVDVERHLATAMARD
jgi:hypothetical protein